MPDTALDSWKHSALGAYLAIDQAWLQDESYLPFKI